ncbi:MAG TPA: hypothetical protein VE954_07385 [Oligoflexus sp.]|uniref:hypothetical protein n=1 Tax=Oligoflexus sp. TaxID=1971216 RepID=UPI002D283369|nr:hypothetical protein [Oligoflexus sp.]HYX32921.1 hypothetical protein [Oligoflexus sp.]
MQPINTYGCSLLTRDTSSCEASRTAQGLSGYWLKFSCRVTLTKSGSNVTVTTDSQPDYKTAYFGSTHACYQTLTATGRGTNPSTLSAQSIAMTVPVAATKAASTTTVSGQIIGLTLNGIAVFGNYADRRTERTLRTLSPQANLPAHWAPAPVATEPSTACADLKEGLCGPGTHTDALPDIPQLPGLVFRFISDLGGPSRGSPGFFQSESYRR